MADALSSRLESFRTFGLAAVDGQSSSLLSVAADTHGFFSLHFDLGSPTNCCDTTSGVYKDCTCICCALFVASDCIRARVRVLVLVVVSCFHVVVHGSSRRAQSVLDMLLLSVHTSICTYLAIMRQQLRRWRGIQLCRCRMSCRPPYR